MKTLTLLTVAFCVLFASAGAFSQTDKLTLEGAIGRAIEQSTYVGVSRENLMLARQDVLNNYGRFLPDLNMNLWAGRNYIGPTPSVFVDAQGRQIDQRGFDHEQYNFSINSNLNLFDWGAKRNALTGSQETAGAATHDLQYQKDIVTAVVIKEYYDFVLNIALRNVQEEGVNAAQKNLEQIEAFYKIGSNTRADVLQAQVRLGNTQLQLITAINNEEIAQATLASRLNLPLEDDLAIEESLDITKVSPSFEAEIQYMLGNRSDLLASRDRVDASSSNRVATERSRWPTIDARISYSWNQRVWPNNSNFFRDNYFWSVGVFANWNIFDRFQTKSQVLGAKAQQRVNEYNLQQDKLNAILEVKTLMLGLKEADERIRVSTGQVTQAEENLRLARERYRVGAGTVLETVEAEASLTEARSSLVRGQCDYLIRKAELQRATGRPVKAD